MRARLASRRRNRRDLATPASADVGEIGPDYRPGHAHADTLCFELSVFGQRLVVNSGTSEYGLGAERLRQRGTAAHSTVQIDGADSSEVWSGFRVARRARPLCRTLDELDGAVILAGGHFVGLDEGEILDRVIQASRNLLDRMDHTVAPNIRAVRC